MSLVLGSVLISQAFSLKTTVRVATVATGTLATAFENGDTVDGVTLATGDRILIKDQSTATENGIYVVEATGAPSRADDFATGISANGIFTWIELGSTNAGHAYICNSASGSDIVDTNNISFVRFDVTSTLTVARGGTGLSSLTSGNVLVGNGTGAVSVSKAAPSGDFVGTTDTQTLTNKTLTAPRIGTSILDTNGNELLLLTATASAVNELTLANAATGGHPTISSSGGDTNINIVLNPKGTGVVDVSTSRITNLADPTSATDAATKQYVDNNAAGLDPKASCIAATTIAGGNLSGATYVPTGGTAGTGSFTTPPGTIDGVTIGTTGQRVLVKNQTDPKQNGIYVLDVSGDWFRADDMDGVPASSVSAGNYVFIEQGTINASTGWVLQGTGVLTLNTDNLNFVKFSSVAGISNRVIYPVFTGFITNINSNNYPGSTPANYLIWDATENSSYNTFRAIFSVRAPNRTLDLRLIRYTDAGTLTDVVFERTGLTTGTYSVDGNSVPFTFPTSGRFGLQWRRSGAGGTNPELYGFSVQFISDRS
jgi:hypothetical protein